MRHLVLALALLAGAALTASGCNSSCSSNGDCLNANWTCQDGTCAPPATEYASGSGSSGSGSSSSGSSGSSSGSGTGTGTGSDSGSSGGP